MKHLRYLILILFGFGQIAFTQTYSELIEFGDREFEMKDYYQARLFYQQAMTIDSNAVSLNWKMAEANRLFKDYRRSVGYYKLVFERDQGRTYPLSIYWLANMYQQLGEYDNAKQAFKFSKKVHKRDREAYHYIKSVQGLKACLWAENQLDNKQTKVTAIGGAVNSNDTELAPFIHENALYYTALKADSVLESEEVISKAYRLNIFKASKFKSTFSDVAALKGLDINTYNYANGTVSADGSRFYFSRCDDSYGCKIFVGQLKDGKVTDIDSLGDIINDVAGTTTMPHIAVIDNEEYLFFVSDRYKTLGGLDIWASKITNGNQYGKVFNLGDRVNSPDNDISPFFDPQTNRLYFSSSWHEGFGGQDIFYAKMIDKNWRFNPPINLGLPINSPQNDTYFFKDTVEGDLYFSSNRVGVNYTKSPNCCNDIFMVKNTNRSNEVVAKFPDLETINNRLPTLYFHNDEPNPKSTDTVTKYNYLITYNQYKNLQAKYKREYSRGLIGDDAEEAKEDIEDFFLEFVERGVNDLFIFSMLLKKELEKGQALQITVKGFASPLAQSDYNVNLTKRRISSFLNYLNSYEAGVLIPYLENGQLSIESIPFGEYTANSFVSDNVNDQKNSVYSRKASLERKIEVQSVALQSKQIIPLKFNELNHDFGMVKSNRIQETVFQMTNSSSDTIVLSKILNECDCSITYASQSIIAPNQTVSISLKYNPVDDTGLLVRRILLQFANGYTKTLSFSAEVSSK